MAEIDWRQTGAADVQEPDRIAVLAAAVEILDGKLDALGRGTVGDLLDLKAVLWLDSVPITRKMAMLGGAVTQFNKISGEGVTVGGLWRQAAGLK